MTRWLAAVVVLLSTRAFAQEAATVPAPAPVPAAVPDPAAAPGAAPLAMCDDPSVTARLSGLVRAHRYADAHHAAVSLRVQCGPRDAEATWRVLDDIALLRLEDRAYAIADLEDLARAQRTDVRTGETHVGANATDPRAATASEPHVGANANDPRTATASEPHMGANATDPRIATASETHVGAAAADVVLAWAYLDDRDDAAAKATLSRLPAPRAAALQALAALDDEDRFAARARALPTPLAARALELGRSYHDARAKSPAAAGILSALVPGAGQVYAGSFEAAAITFALNALFIGATVELALDKSYATSAAAGTAASFFYVGGIVNAVDLARRRNHVAQQPYADRLEELLVPELSGDVGAGAAPPAR